MEMLSFAQYNDNPGFLPALVKDHHFHIPLLVCLGLTVLAVLVTSGGMARNNVVVLIGASFYEFAGKLPYLNIYLIDINIKY